MSPEQFSARCGIFIFVVWSFGCFGLLPTLCNSQAADLPAPAAAGRERLSLERGWRFNLGDIPFPIVTGHAASYNNAKAGSAGGAASLDYDDSLWPTVDLPHDWALQTPIDEKNNLSQGFHARGIGWYRRSFRVDKADRCRHLELQFDGVSTHCEVWVNGLIAARNWCGYTSFYIDITPFARYGDDLNTIAVRVDADAQEAWWYEGAGIYRHVWLVKRSPVHIVTNGVDANPVRDSAGKWSVPVEVTLGSSAVGLEKVHTMGSSSPHTGLHAETLTFTFETTGHPDYLIVNAICEGIAFPYRRPGS